jgi:serine/threonine protein kinase/Leucine-rich repeat (LRR) protein
VETTIDSVCTLLVRTRLMAEPDVQALRQRWLAEAGSAKGDVSAFGKWLVERQYVTGYQAERLLRGHTDHYFFNQYQLLDRLGQGRMAGVFKAMHRLGQVVAIKVLPPSKAKDPQALGRFLREARLALKLKHPNVVRTFQTGKDGGLNYLVMEHLQGETLEEVLARRGKLPPDEAVRLIHQALAGLQHLHEKGMVHRDLKPANLMLVGRAPGQPDSTLQCTLKILDIGVGRALFDEGDPGGGAQEDLTTAGDMLGSPDYMAPEQARDAHSADIRADLYTLGCVLYHALTSQPPFPDGNAVQKLMKHAKQPPPPLQALAPNVPDGLVAIVGRLLAKDPAQRYATPEQAARDMQAFLNRDPAADAERARPVASQAYESWLEAEEPDEENDSERPRPPAPAKRRLVPMLVVAGVAGLVLGAVGLFVASRLGRSSGDQRDPPGGNKVVKKEGGSENDKGFADWVEKASKLKGDEQVKAVAAKLKERNPSFDEKVEHREQDGVVTELEFVSDEVSDLSPLRALASLTRLNCAGSAPGKGQVADLTPLRGMTLAVLDCSNTRVSDLSPLRDMPLVYLGVSGTRVRDLSPVEGAPLLAVNCAGTHVADLAPLAGMQLTSLDAADAPVTDLSPLRLLPLQSLWCNRPERDAELLLSIRSLQRVNGKPLNDLRKAAVAQKQDFDKWAKGVAALPPGQQAEAVIARLKERNPRMGNVQHHIDGNAVVELRFVCDAVTDLSPVRALAKLRRLFCNGSKPGAGKLSNLEPLRGLQLEELDCEWSQVRDLAPLRGMRLKRLLVAGNPGITDLAPIAGMPLEELQLEGCTRLASLDPVRRLPRLASLKVGDTAVRDLAPLRGLKLTSLSIHQTPVSDLAPLRDMPLQSISCGFQPDRDSAVLRSIRTLERIDNRPAAEFWKEIDARQKEHTQFVQSVRSLPADAQVRAVEDRLRKMNPGFAGRVSSSPEKGVVTELGISADNVKDLSPVLALVGLRKLSCTGSEPGKGKLAVLPNLKALPLRVLNVSATAVRDLSPLRGMKLEELNIADTAVDDLKPLAGMPLRELRCPPELEQEEVLRPMKTLVKVNGKLVGKEPPNPPPPNKKPPKPPKLTASFEARVVDVQLYRRNLVVKITEPVVHVNGHHHYWLQRHQVDLLSAQLDRDIRSRIRRIQHHALWITYHRQRLYDYRFRDHNLHVKLDDAVKVRTQVLPPKYNDKGKQRPYTKAELDDIKGPDKRLPGYNSNAEFLDRQQVVRVYLTGGEVKQVKDEKAVDPRPRATMVVILR